MCTMVKSSGDAWTEVQIRNGLMVIGSGHSGPSSKTSSEYSSSVVVVVVVSGVVDVTSIWRAAIPRFRK